jgi:hypothetical protein
LATASQGHAFVNGKHFDLDDVGCSVVPFLSYILTNSSRDFSDTCKWKWGNSCSIYKNRYVSFISCNFEF